MNIKLLIIKCPKCNYENNLGEKENNFKTYQDDYNYPYVKCPKCDYRESVY